MIYVCFEHVACGVGVCDWVWVFQRVYVWYTEFFTAEYHDVHELPVRVPVLGFPAACVGVCDHGGYGGLPDLFGGG